ncbi:cytochrome c oxidase subunit III [Pseudohongiella nitratireducens]|uniref:cytochrome-c oxidase n=1 Tax=Pseudohongiella nitratireducens TaxID=1768907 RepID=A0A917GWB5_9GAMM|nr:cytochrome c oxidase subunit 3 [Pseudohongiella nitratireducens]MDF1623960.1 cytochrome c oxidase subunit 3 [Pseudohongiella nitratireducens]GGG59187.1 cytochrome c oxidase subunit III [Pseudohongiella nitratireducens]|tara:strand:- start:1808 stop:2734 length:927 start_codon:yes stop_codon:yes gene_type:complete
MASESSHSVYYVPEQTKFPFFASIGLFFMVFGLGSVLNDISASESATGSTWIALAGFTLLSFIIFQWFATVIRENHAGLNNEQLKRSYVWGMLWFIFSEVMFFAAFFGALFYVRNLSVPWLGGEGEKGVAGEFLWPEFQAAWPLINNPDSSIFTNPHEALNVHEWSLSFFAGYLPFWNTVILITSSVTLHYAHHALKHENRKRLIQWMFVTVGLGIIFLGLQALEYVEAYGHYGLTLDSGIYGSTFFLLTGFHGFHVTLGTFILIVMLLRCLKGHFKPDDHFGFEAAAWYWHFVDVVWVMLFFFVYLL